MKYRILAAIIALVAVTSLAAAQPSIMVSDQDINDSIVVVDSVTADQAGWVVIHMADGEEAGAAIGVVDVGTGTSEDIQVIIDTADLQEGDNDLIAMLHLDEPANGVFDFPDGDDPATVNGEVVQQSFVATLPAAAVTPAEEETPIAEEETPVIEETPVEAETPVEVVTPSPATPGLTGLIALGVLGAVAYLMRRR